MVRVAISPHLARVWEDGTKEGKIGGKEKGEQSLRENF
jgi:hypothetical protein